EANIHFARAIGAARSGDLAAARAAVARLEAIKGSLSGYWADQVEIQRLGASAWVARAEKKDEEALKLAHEAAALEASTEKHPVTPGAIIPARELLADLLLELGQREEAKVELAKVLKVSPGRRSAEQMVKAVEARSAY
ncbi:MAG TPA: hypothetical protein VLV48_06785, partial [Thermoanaerobaculia bacterium]|nr:hypothetical protein [Thermoanaerobaculia bacterium]